MPPKKKKSSTSKEGQSEMNDNSDQPQVECTYCGAPLRFLLMYQHFTTQHKDKKELSVRAIGSYELERTAGNNVDSESKDSAGTSSENPQTATNQGSMKRKKRFCSSTAEDLARPNSDAESAAPRKKPLSNPTEDVDLPETNSESAAPVVKPQKASKRQTTRKPTIESSEEDSGSESESESESETSLASEKDAEVATSIKVPKRRASMAAKQTILALSQQMRHEGASDDLKDEDFAPIRGRKRRQGRSSFANSSSSKRHCSVKDDTIKVQATQATSSKRRSASFTSVRPDVKPFEFFCPDCKKGFREREHLRVHTYRCIYCSTCKKWVNNNYHPNPCTKKIEKKTRLVRCGKCNRWQANICRHYRNVHHLPVDHPDRDDISRLPHKYEGEESEQGSTSVSEESSEESDNDEEEQENVANESASGGEDFVESENQAPAVVKESSEDDSNEESGNDEEEPEAVSENDNNETTSTSESGDEDVVVKIENPAPAVVEEPFEGDRTEESDNDEEEQQSGGEDVVKSENQAPAVVEESSEDDSNEESDNDEEEQEPVLENAPEGKSHDEKKNLVGKAKTFDDNSEAKSLVHAIQNNHLHIEKMAELLELAMKLPNENRREESKSAIVCPLTICPTRYTYGTKLDSSGTAVARNLWSHLNSKHDRSTWPLKAIPIKSTEEMSREWIQECKDVSCVLLQMIRQGHVYFANVPGGVRSMRRDENSFLDGPNSRFYTPDLLSLSSFNMEYMIAEDDKARRHAILQNHLTIEQMALIVVQQLSWTDPRRKSEIKFLSCCPIAICASRFVYMTCSTPQLDFAESFVVKHLRDKHSEDESQWPLHARQYAHFQDKYTWKRQSIEISHGLLEYIEGKSNFFVPRSCRSERLLYESVDEPLPETNPPSVPSENKGPERSETTKSPDTPAGMPTLCSAGKINLGEEQGTCSQPVLKQTCDKPKKVVRFKPPGTPAENLISGRSSSSPIQSTARSATQVVSEVVVASSQHVDKVLSTQGSVTDDANTVNTNFEHRRRTESEESEEVVVIPDFMVVDPEEESETGSVIILGSTATTTTTNQKMLEEQQIRSDCIIPFGLPDKVAAGNRIPHLMPQDMVVVQYCPKFIIREIIAVLGTSEPGPSPSLVFMAIQQDCLPHYIPVYFMRRCSRGTRATNYTLFWRSVRMIEEVRMLYCMQNRFHRRLPNFEN